MEAAQSISSKIDDIDDDDDDDCDSERFRNFTSERRSLAVSRLQQHRHQQLLLSHLEVIEDFLREDGRHSTTAACGGGGGGGGGGGEVKMELGLSSG